MAQNTAPFFILSSGRSGTKMMEKLFSTYPQVEMHHEYMVHHIQPAAVQYQLGLISLGDVARLVEATYKAAVHYTPQPLWGDSSNKLCWIVEALDHAFPTAKFVHLVRDGRKVASSYLNKLGAECYDDASVAALNAYLTGRADLAPPPEKKFWWPQPAPGSPAYGDFMRYDQFQRIAWHWAAAHAEVERQLGKISASRQLFIRLEDLTADPATVDRLTDFLCLPRSGLGYELLARPHNVNTPRNFPLSPTQRRQFEEIAGAALRAYGYEDALEYSVNY